VKSRDAARWVAGFALVDLLFLRWVYLHFGHWGFWDWDYQLTLLEAARLAVVEHGELPLWNPYLGGGTTLAGHTLNHTWSPSFLVVLLFGTLGGTKLCIAIYLAIAQWGVFRLARGYGLAHQGAAFAALIFSLGGVYAQRLAHGQFEWIAIAWVPFVIHALDRARESAAGGESAEGLRQMALAALFFALVILDGGPYQFAFFGVFLAFYALAHATLARSTRPILQLGGSVAWASGIAAIKLWPVFEWIARFPRETTEDAFYGAPFEPEFFGVLYQMFLSRAQAHDPALWMPYVLNVGSYVGLLPLVLAGLGVAWAGRRHAAWIASGAFALWLSLGAAAPVDLWHLLHRLPGFDMLRVPSRFNVYALLAIALLAGAGLDALRSRLTNPRYVGPAGFAILLATVANLVVVNGEVFKPAFSIPPLAIEARSEAFRTHYAHSPFIERYRAAALYPTHPNWPSGSFPAVLENRGVRWPFKTVPFPSYALASEDPGYRGEVFVASGPGRIEAVEQTPNRIAVTLDGRAALVRINTNADPGWRARGASGLTPAELDGTLAVNVPEGVRSFELVYRPGSFVAGAAVSLLCTIAAASSIARARRS